MKDEVQLKKVFAEFNFCDYFTSYCLFVFKNAWEFRHFSFRNCNSLSSCSYALVFNQKKELNPVSLVAIIGFLISLLAVYLTHGNNLAFKLWHPILTAAIGTIFLLSVLLDRPLLELASEGENHRKMLIMTLFMGLVFIFHALSVILLAFFVETTAFVLLSKVIDFSAVGVLVLGLAFLRKIKLKSFII